MSREIEVLVSSLVNETTPEEPPAQVTQVLSKVLDEQGNLSHYLWVDSSETRPTEDAASTDTLRLLQSDDLTNSEDGIAQSN